MSRGDSDSEFVADSPWAEEAATTAHTALLSQAAMAANIVVRCAEVPEQPKGCVAFRTGDVRRDNDRQATE